MGGGLATSALADVMFDRPWEADLSQIGSMMRCSGIMPFQLIRMIAAPGKSRDIPVPIESLIERLVHHRELNRRWTTTRGLGIAGACGSAEAEVHATILSLTISTRKPRREARRTEQHLFT